MEKETVWYQRGISLKSKLSLWLLFAIFFVFLGFLEASILGGIAGFIVWALANYTLPIALIPFVGYYLWKGLIDLVFSNFSKFLVLSSLQDKLFLIYGIPACLLTVLTSIITVLIVVYLIWYFWQRQKVKALSSNWARCKFLKSFAEKKVTSLGELDDFIQNLIEKIGQLDKKIVGSALFWLGVGIASHDFHWETSEWEVDVERPTHGAYLGLSLVTLGLDLIERSYLKKLWAYLGLGFCYLAFFLLSFIPK